MPTTAIAVKPVLLSRSRNLLEFRSTKKNATAGVLSRIGLRLFTTSARTERSQIVVSVNSRTVTVVPAEFDGVITHRADLL
jgi:hypothetical protein